MGFSIFSIEDVLQYQRKLKTEIRPNPSSSGLGGVKGVRGAKIIIWHRAQASLGPKPPSR